MLELRPAISSRGGLLERESLDCGAPDTLLSDWSRMPAGSPRVFTGLVVSVLLLAVLLHSQIGWSSEERLYILPKPYCLIVIISDDTFPWFENNP